MITEQTTLDLDVLAASLTQLSKSLERFPNLVVFESNIRQLALAVGIAARIEAS